MKQHLAVVTGTNSGFGLLITLALARGGFHVVATMRDLSRRAALDQAAAEAGLTSSITVARLDVADPASHAAFAAETLATYGRIDLLVNNAGFAMAGFSEDVSLEELRRQFETNFFGTVSLTQAILPVMRRQRAGRIIMLSSISGRTGFPAMSPYVSSKFALEGYTESLRLEMAPLGIDCILIEPGSFETSIWYRQENAAARAWAPESPNYERAMRLRERLLKNKKGRRDPREVARLIARVATEPRPRLRYVIGPDARVMLLLRRLLSWRAFERLVARMVQLDR